MHVQETRPPHPTVAFLGFKSHQLRSPAAVVLVVILFGVYLVRSFCLRILAGLVSNRSADDLACRKSNTMWGSRSCLVQLSAHSLSLCCVEESRCAGETW